MAGMAGIAGKYVLSCRARAANISSIFLLHSTAAGDDPDADGLTYPDPTFLHFTDGQPLILLHNMKYRIKRIPRRGGARGVDPFNLDRLPHSKTFQVPRRGCVPSKEKSA